MSEKKAKFVASGRDGEVLVDAVRLVGDGWSIQIKPDGEGVEIYAAGILSGSDRLLVLPRTGNVIRVTNDALHQLAVHKEAERLIEIEKANRAFWKTKGKAKKRVRKAVDAARKPNV